MTLPFENDTSRIVKKYAKHSISQSRVKTFLSVLTIALAVALLSGFALSVIGMETEAKRELLVSSQMLYHNLNDEQTEEFLSSGGFDTKAAGEYVAKRDGCYRIPCVLIGLEQDAYEDYLMQSGVTYSEQGAALIVNSVVKILTPEVMKPKKIWFHI